MPQFEVLYKMSTFKLVDGKFKAHTLVTVRLKDNKVVTVLVPLPEHLVKDSDIEKVLREKKLI
jgi:hypothetical protein